jgi:hypothetical protein
LPGILRLLNLQKIISIGFFEKSSLVAWFANRTVVFDGKESMAGRSQQGGRKGIALFTKRANASAPSRWPFARYFRVARRTFPWRFTLIGFGQLSACGTYKNILGMSFIFSEEIAGEKVKILPTFATLFHLYP